MKDSGKKDSILTVAGLLLLVGVFVFVFYLPGKKVSAQIQKELAAAQQDIQSIPSRVAELEMLKQTITDQQQYLELTEPALPKQVDLHAVIERVSNLAKQHQLKISRMEPLPAEQFESYQVIPFHTSFSGSFQGVMGFLKGLENQKRLFSVEKLTLSKGNGGPAEEITAGMYYSVYVRNVARTNSTENNSSSN